jgi:hypothetical protein
MLGFWNSWRGDQEARRSQPSRVLNTVLITAGVALAWAMIEVATASVRTAVPPAEFRGALPKLTHLVAPFYSLSLLQLTAMAGAYLFALIAFALQNRREAWANAFLLSGLMFLLLYTISPGVASAAGDVDTRWLPAAYLLPFCMPGRTRPSRTVLYALFGLCLIHAGIVRWNAVGIDAELTDLDHALGQLPARTRVLPLISDQDRHGRVQPYLHYTLWHIIRKQGRVPGLFSASGARPSQPAYPHFSHFRVLRRAYLPDGSWGVRSWEPLNCARIRQDYDYVLEAGEDAAAKALILKCAPEVFRVGEITVYRVPTAPNPGFR